jgi:hypothetical protein
MGDVAIFQPASWEPWVVVTGWFDSPFATFGDTHLFSPNQNVNEKRWDVFVVKISAAGTVIWAKSGGGLGADQGAGVAVDQVR